MSPETEPAMAEGERTQDARTEAAARAWIGEKSDGTHPWDEPDAEVDAFKKHALRRMEIALAAADRVTAPQPAAAEHAEWCNTNVNNLDPCDCGGNAGRCPQCGAQGPCGFAADDSPLICRAASASPDLIAPLAEALRKLLDLFEGFDPKGQGFSGFGLAREAGREAIANYDASQAVTTERTATE